MLNNLYWYVYHGVDCQVIQSEGKPSVSFTHSEGRKSAVIELDPPIAIDFHQMALVMAPGASGVGVHPVGVVLLSPMGMHVARIPLDPVAIEPLRS